MRIRLLTILPLFIITLSVMAQESEKACFNEINSNDFKLMMETKDVLIIDVRLNKDYRKERIDNAYLASSKEALEDFLETADKNQIIVVYCKEGNRSKVAAEIVCKELQFKNVFNLQGGIDAWKNKGYYVDNKQIRR